MYISYQNSTIRHSLHRSAAARQYTVRISKKLALRLFLSVIMLLIVFTFGALVHANADDNGLTTIIQNQSKIVVEQGETLWAIASANAAADQDVRGYIEQIKKLNGLNSSSLQAGQVLLLP